MIQCMSSFKNIIFQFACGGFEERVVIPDDRYWHKRLTTFALKIYIYIFSKILSVPVCRYWWRPAGAAQADSGGGAQGRRVQSLHDGQKCLQGQIRY